MPSPTTVSTRRFRADASSTNPDRVLLDCGEIRIGAFRCPVEHPEFGTAGPIEGYTVAFPRSAVWIQHDGRPPFVADPGVATIYNRGQPYARRPLARDGDRSDWFSVSRALAESLVATFDPEAAGDAAGPFPIASTRVPAELYYQQRLLFSRVIRGELSDPFEVEQEVIALLGAVFRPVLGRRHSTAGSTADQRELVERTRAELGRDPFARPTVRELARQVGASPFHLCRVFRRVTGLTLHHYLLELRTRVAFERFEQGGSLSRLASDLGFSSHSHFTAEFRRRVGTVPSTLRRELCGVTAGSGTSAGRSASGRPLS
jgi:AraC-like DNA-binding protein